MPRRRLTRATVGHAVKFLFLLLAVVEIAGCNFVPRKVAMNDPRIQPLLDAANSFQRTIYGFTPLPREADVRWESRPTKRYDAMLHITGRTSRTIAFRRDGQGYRWTGEQETFEGPKKYKTPDGTFNESVCLTYEIERDSGYPLNRLNVAYFGEDSRFENRHDLTFDSIRPLLVEWGYYAK